MDKYKQHFANTFSNILCGHHVLVQGYGFRGSFHFGGTFRFRIMGIKWIRLRIEDCVGGFGLGFGIMEKVEVSECAKSS